MHMRSLAVVKGGDDVKQGIIDLRSDKMPHCVRCVFKFLSKTLTLTTYSKQLA